MKHLATFALVAVAVATPITMASVTAAGNPHVDYAFQADDAATAAPQVALHGRNLHRFESFDLRKGEASQGLLEAVFQAKDTVVLALPANTPPGAYTVRCADHAGNPTDIPLQLRIPGALPGTIKAADLDPTLQATLGAFAYRSDLDALSASLSGYATKGDMASLAPKALTGSKACLGSNASMGASSGFQTVSFDGTEFDTDGCRSTYAPSKLTCKVDGYYLVTAKLLLPTSMFFVEIWKNGSRVSGDAAYSAVYGTTINLATAVHLTVGDYLEVAVKGSNGNAFTVTGGTGTSEFSMVKVGE